ncbi:hypothetical protein EC973_001382 [Apophysomyces ossiformis]|uniref:RRM domain-containing protein n=1 Tax=Apophysomyces ossiformis TaxID=679940 RepID=A0A8H7ETE8_9FUNG|nr:hypothetical protein EC973_001382 [Apophysomyces ossiformis]
MAISVSSVCSQQEQLPIECIQSPRETDSHASATPSSEPESLVATHTGETDSTLGEPGSVTHVRQLFVANLPFRVRWQDLKDLFRKAGNVQRADVALSYDNRSKGHGTVLFATVQDAQHAIDMLHNYKWQGRVLEVREDRGFIEPHRLHHQQHQLLSRNNGTMTQHRRVQEISPFMGLYLAQSEFVPPINAGRQLYVGNLPFHCQWQDVKDLFRNAGNILRADVAQAPDGRSKGYGTVLFATREDARKAMVMYNGFEFHGRQLRVHFDKFAPGNVLSNQHSFAYPHPPPPTQLQASQQAQPPRYAAMDIQLRPPSIPAFESTSTSYMSSMYPTASAAAAFSAIHGTSLLQSSQSSHRSYMEEHSQLGFNSLVDPFPPMTTGYPHPPLYPNAYQQEKTAVQLSSDLPNNVFGSLGVSKGENKGFGNVDVGSKVDVPPTQQRPLLFPYSQSTRHQASFPVYQWNPSPSSDPVTPLQEEPITSSQSLYLSSPSMIHATTATTASDGVVFLTDAMNSMGLTDGSAGLTAGRKESMDRLLDSSNGVWHPLGGFKM